MKRYASSWLQLKALSDHFTEVSKQLRAARWYFQNLSDRSYLFTYYTIDSVPGPAVDISLSCARRKRSGWLDLSWCFTSLNRLCTRSQMQLKTIPVQRGLNTWSVNSPSSYWIITMMKLPMYALKMSNYLKILNCWKFWNHVKMKQARKLGSWNYRSLTHSLNEWLIHWQG